MVKTFIIAAALVGSAMAACPNGCSANGICGANDKCSCFQNWQGADCSLRTCTYSLAWADTADGTNSAHYYAECSNKGVCDRKTAECKCFDGYEGKGCRRSTCPEKCSGHGTCEYIDELAGDFYDRRTGPGNIYKTQAGTKIGGVTAVGAEAQAVPTATTRTDDVEQYHGFLYDLWDAQKIQGCKCDLGYDGPDCAHRISPKGDDPLTTVKSQMMTQIVQIGGAGAGFDFDEIPQNQFIMVYHDPYGGVWRTDGIDTSSSDATAAANVQAALRNLPNEVLDGVSVSAMTVAAAAGTACVRKDGVQSISAHSTEHIGWHTDSKQVANKCTIGSVLASALNYMDMKVAFADKPGQTGVQYLLEVDVNARGPGSFPVSAGIAAENILKTTNAANGYPEGYTVIELAYDSGAAAGVQQGVLYGGYDSEISELAECSDRGLDNGDGECECFDGFRGLACEEQEALV